MGYFVFNSEVKNISQLPASVSIENSRASGFSSEIVSNNQHATSGGSNVHGTWAEDPSSEGKSTPNSLSEQYADDKPEGHDVKPIKGSFEHIHPNPAVQSLVEDSKDTNQEFEDGDIRANAKGWRPQGGDTTTVMYSGKKGQSNAPPVREKWSDRPQFEQALTKIINLLPDEVHMRELIRPIEGSGKEKMREMGLRTRAYKKYFDAWEALHMTIDGEGATYIRDDLIPYLRNHQQSLDGAQFAEEGVEGLNLEATVHAYEAYRVFLQKFANLLFPWFMPYFSDHMTLHTSFKKGGRGIVLTAGDDQAPYLLTTIYTYRQLGCTLPIEVMYLGEQDLGEDYRAELEALPGVVTRDVASMTNDEGWKLAGWAAKPFAILLSSFREVIFIDADSLFFKNPEVLFDDPDYARTGALFFKDRLIMPESKKRWLQQVFPKPIPKAAKESRWWSGESGHMQESGVIVVDKWKHFISLMLITRFNGPDRDGNKEKGITGVYDMMYGDKETFWIGFLLAGDENWAFHKGHAGIMGELKKDEENKEAAPKTKRDEPLNGLTPGLNEGGDSNEGSMASTEPASPTEIAAAQQSEEAALMMKEATVVQEAPKNYTICAPQLLHLDIQGRPLWFNGWLLHNKFAEKSKKRFAAFDHYLVENKNPHAWQLAESNMCCLTVDESRRFSFSDEERETLKMIMDRARETGMGEQAI